MVKKIDKVMGSVTENGLDSFYKSYGKFVKQLEQHKRLNHTDVDVDVDVRSGTKGLILGAVTFYLILIAFSLILFVAEILVEIYSTMDFFMVS